MKINRIPATTPPFKPTTVDLREPLVADFIAAERIAGRADGYKFSLAVMAQVCTFDGQAKVAEDLEALTSTDFLALSAEINTDGCAVATPPDKSPPE